MTQEEKQLLLKDICARLPYGVMVQSVGENKILGLSDLSNPDLFLPKPYLRPMSSMTEEELKEFYMIEGMDTKPIIWNKPQYDWHFTTNGIDYLLSHHFDYRGLIPMGLALEASENMYKEN